MDHPPIFRQPPEPLETGNPLDPRDVVGRLLRVPLFYKVLIANSILVIIGAIAGTEISLKLGEQLGTRGSWLAVLFAVIGVGLTISLNTIILRAALQPIRWLRGTVSSLDKGDFTARVPQSPLADSDLATVADALNATLDHLQRYQDRVQDLSANILQAQEAERRRIARELHDQIGQSLTLLLIRLKIIAATPQAAGVERELADLRAAVAATIDEVRKLALDLRPPALDQLGLIPAVRTLIREYTEQTHIPVQIDAPNETIVIAPERATAVYRIVQEALTNIAKHADAHMVQVTLLQDADSIHIAVSDDGRGFDLKIIHQGEQAREGPGLGLFGMEERTRLLGGTADITTKLGAGTVVTATIPLQPSEHLHGKFTTSTESIERNTTTNDYTHSSRR